MVKKIFDILTKMFKDHRTIVIFTINLREFFAWFQLEVFYGPALQRSAKQHLSVYITSHSLHRTHNACGDLSKSGLSTDCETQSSYSSPMTKHQQCFSALLQRYFRWTISHFGRYDKICLKCGRTYSLNYFSRQCLSSCIDIADDSDRLISAGSTHFQSWRNPQWWTLPIWDCACSVRKMNIKEKNIEIT